MASELVDGGVHGKVEILEGKDINGMFMVFCKTCETCAHAIDKSEAIKDLLKTPCVTDCENCKNLRHSFDKQPAVPINGSCNDESHVCPNDGNRWWQYNTYYHLWKQVTNTKEWLNITQSD